MKRISLLSIVCLLLMVPANLHAAERFSLGGYYKSYFVVTDEPAIKNSEVLEDQPLFGAVSNRIRLKSTIHPAKRLLLTVEYDLSAEVRDYNHITPDFFSGEVNRGSYRAFDPDSRLYPAEGKRVAGNFTIHQNLDRALVSIGTGPADIYIGRQAIAWGSAHFINPTDIFLPYVFNEFDVEDRRGIDAVRMRIPLGFMSEIDAGYVFGRDFYSRNSAAFGRVRLYYWRTDIALLAMAFRENLLLGFDLTRALGGAAGWVEGAYVFVDAIGTGKRESGEDYFRLSLGLDYIFVNGTYLFGEYHYNQPGARSADQYADRLFHSDNAAYGEGAVYLLGEHYLASGIAYQATPLLSLTGEMMANVADPSLFLLLRAEDNIASNVYVAAGAYFGLGKGPEYKGGLPFFPEVSLRSEFGTYPRMFFTSFRLYF